MLQGLPNFRDFGGHPTTDGRRVRPGVLFRSQAFHEATEDDLERLANLEIRLVCDLRSHLEREQAPGRWPAGSEPARLHMDIRADVRAGHADFIEAIRSQPDQQGVRRAMLAIYSGMPAAFAPVLPQLLAQLLNADNLPAVIHCHAGKDRTGFICAVILAALGVDREHILADYLLTAARLDPSRLRRDVAQSFSAFVGVSLDTDSLQPALETRPEYLEAAMQALETNYGGVTGYIRTVGKLGPENLERLRGVLLW